jgi:hypothetical protein
MNTLTQSNQSRKNFHIKAKFKYKTATIFIFKIIIFLSSVPTNTHAYSDDYTRLASAAIDINSAYERDANREKIIDITLFAAIIGGAIFIGTKGKTKTCPHCKEKIKEKASICKHCGKDVNH